MIVIGLTGSIGMGKSTTAKMFEKQGVPIFDADKAVHELYSKGGRAVGPIAAIYPQVIRDGAVDRAALAKEVLGNRAALRKIEAIVHPLVGTMRKEFLAEQDRRGEPMVVLDIPLLFETGGSDGVDVIVVVTAPAEVQRQRVLERPGMTEETFERILAQQVPDLEKRRQADYLVETDKGFEDAERQVAAILKQIKTGFEGKKSPAGMPTLKSDSA